MIAFPNETAEYRAAREALLQREVALRREMEALAEERRALPPGSPVTTDYRFHEALPDGSERELGLADLFRADLPALAVYHFMFPRHPNDGRAGPSHGTTAALPLAETPCPSCTALLDQLDGAAPHLAQRMAFVVVAKAGAARLAAFGRERGWRHLRLVSAAGSAFNRDYQAEGASGSQQPMLNVFERDADGAVRHFWGAELLYEPIEPGQEMRHVGTLEPLWNMFDLTRQGRPSGWDEQHDYACCNPG